MSLQTPLWTWKGIGPRVLRDRGDRPHVFFLRSRRTLLMPAAMVAHARRTDLVECIPFQLYRVYIRGMNGENDHPQLISNFLPRIGQNHS
jgi:hypothetical protein